MVDGKMSRVVACLVLGGTVALFLGAGCPLPDILPEDVIQEHNTTDPTNKGASFLGSAVCMSCHEQQAAKHKVHGHSHKLKKLSNGGGPKYPSEGTRAGIPNPPTGSQWEDITYVIGGYIRKGRFIDSQGFVMTNGVDGVDTQWNLDFLPTGTTAGWTSYHSTEVNPKPYNYSCFVCHTTGPSEDGHQDSLEGIVGTFAEPGVQCEACHGPGSNHVGTPVKVENIYINEEASFCGTCHSRGDDMDVIPASGGFIRHHQQFQELLASPHANLRCLTCHETHTSVNYQRDSAIINDCRACHANQNMALHQGKIFVRGDFVERLDCESCHMTYATKSAAAAGEAVVGADGRMGDMRTHLWLINTDPVDFNSMFSADGTTVKKDTNGKAKVTVDFVCLRCHSDKGNAFALTVPSASDIALEMHQPVP